MSNPLQGIPYYPASTSNYTKGRSGYSVKYFTVHHSAGWEQSLKALWQNPNRGGSSHFWVGNKPGHIEQYVDTDDTAWTNGNWVSNCESVTCEVRGDWRGYHDQATLDNLSDLMYRNMKLYPNIALTFHQDVSSAFTECPADLKHKGYALQAWNKAKARLAAENAPKPKPNPTPSPAQKLVAIDIPNKIYVTTKDADLWDLSFDSWGAAKSVKKYPKGTQIEMSASVDHPLGGRYLLSEYSFQKGIMNGFNVADITDYKAPVQPPKPEPVPPVVETPVEPEKPEPIVENPPVTETPSEVPPKNDEKPSEPTNTHLNALAAFIFDQLTKLLAQKDKIIAWVKSLFNKSERTK